MKIRRALSADERALLEALLCDAAPRILGYVRRTFGGRVDAEEIVAETFARAADNITTLRTRERKDLYLLRVARNLCLDAFRRPRPQTSTEGQLSEQPSPASGPSERLAEREDIRRMLAAVHGLPDIYREVVALRFSAGLKFEEIAELLGIPLGTALSRMNTALKRLRKELGYVHAHGQHERTIRKL